MELDRKYFDQRMDAIEHKVDSVLSRLTSIEDYIEYLDTRMDDLSDDVEDNVELEIAQTSIATLNDEIDRLDGELEIIRDAIVSNEISNEPDEGDEDEEFEEVEIEVEIEGLDEPTPLNDDAPPFFQHTIRLGQEMGGDTTALADNYAG